MSARSLRKYLADNGITNADLARRLGVFKGTVGRWLDPESPRTPSTEVAFRLEAETGGAVPARGWVARKHRAQTLHTQTASRKTGTA